MNKISKLVSERDYYYWLASIYGDSIIGKAYYSIADGINEQLLICKIQELF